MKTWMARVKSPDGVLMIQEVFVGEEPPTVEVVRLSGGGFEDERAEIDAALYKGFLALDAAEGLAQTLWPSRIVARRVRAILDTLLTLRDYVLLLKES